MANYDQRAKILCGLVDGSIAVTKSNRDGRFFISDDNEEPLCTGRLFWRGIIRSIIPERISCFPKEENIELARYASMQSDERFVLHVTSTSSTVKLILGKVNLLIEKSIDKKEWLNALIIALRGNLEPVSMQLEEPAI